MVSVTTAEFVERLRRLLDELAILSTERPDIYNAWLQPQADEFVRASLSLIRDVEAKWRELGGY